MDVYLEIRSRYQGGTDEEMALISLCLDRVANLTDLQIRRLVDARRQSGVLLKESL